MLGLPIWDLVNLIPEGVHKTRVYSVGVYSGKVYNARATNLGPGKPLTRSFRNNYTLAAMDLKQHFGGVYKKGVYSVGVYSAGVYTAWATDLGPGNAHT